MNYHCHKKNHLKSEPQIPISCYHLSEESCGHVDPNRCSSERGFPRSPSVSKMKKNQIFTCMKSVGKEDSGSSAVWEEISEMVYVRSGPKIFSQSFKLGVEDGNPERSGTCISLLKTGL